MVNKVIGEELTIPLFSQQLTTFQHTAPSGAVSSSSISAQSSPTDVSNERKFRLNPVIPSKAPTTFLRLLCTAEQHLRVVPVEQVDFAFVAVLAADC